MEILTPTRAQSKFKTPQGMRITGKYSDAFSEILTPSALLFLKELHTRFNPRRLELLEKREERQLQLNAGVLPDFLPDTRFIRESSWTIAPLPDDLKDRRVEITGPVERKMVINALNSGAKMFMADLEDSNTPTWENNIGGQINLRDAVRKTISYTSDSGKIYKLNPQTATLLVRPRGWHLPEKNIAVEDVIMSGALVDFGLYFFHNYLTCVANNSAPYFYLPKLESHLEARLWNDVFLFAQKYVGIPSGTIKATVLIETILATFELNEILYELREHSAGLNCGRWDYIFSYIKKLRGNGTAFVLPDRSKITMAVPFMSNYAQLVVKTCHKRNAPAIGGMAAFIPVKNDAVANAGAIERVKQDKLREVSIGHDGTWVAHPGLVEVAMQIFNANMPTPNQIDRQRDDFNCSANDLLTPPIDTITETGLRLNINVGILYIESWLRGNGAAAIYNLMEDAATAEISRAQIWQWIQNKSKLDDGRTITYDLCQNLQQEELEKIKVYVGPENFQTGRFDDAIKLFNKLIKNKEFIEFLTLPAYKLL